MIFLNKLFFINFTMTGLRFLLFNYDAMIIWTILVSCIIMRRVFWRIAYLNSIVIKRSDAVNVSNLQSGCNKLIWASGCYFVFDFNWSSFFLYYKLISLFVLIRLRRPSDKKYIDIIFKSKISYPFLNLMHFNCHQYQCHIQKTIKSA